MFSSLNECPRCWETLCTCGWKYRLLSKEKRIALASVVLGVEPDKIELRLEVPEIHPQENVEPNSLRETPKGYLGREAFMEKVRVIEADLEVLCCKTPHYTVGEVMDGLYQLREGLTNWGCSCWAGGNLCRRHPKPLEDKDYCICLMPIGSKICHHCKKVVKPVTR